jgi:hypothetical protein
MSNGITIIEAGTFRECTSLTSIIIPNGVTSIRGGIPGGGAFHNCTSLASIIIPSSVISIDGYPYTGAFYNCKSLTSITNLNLVPVDINSDVFEGVNTNACTLTVATSAVSAYQNANQWKEFKIVGGGILVNPISSNSNYGYTTGNKLYKVNETATVTATAHSNCKFINWTKNGTEVSTNNTYSFTVTEDVELIANFEKTAYSVSISVNNEEYGSATGGGIYEKNETAAVTATAFTGYKFVNWTKNGVEISKDNPYSFTVTEDVTLVANFEEGVGIVETENEPSLRVYPNPTDGELKISLPNPSEGGAYKAWEVKNIEVFDVFGRSVYIAHPPLWGGLEGLDISHLPSGIYFLRIQTENEKVIMKKIIKN